MNNSKIQDQTKTTKQVMLAGIFAMVLMLSALSFVVAEENSTATNETLVIAPAPVADDFDETSSLRIGWEKVKLALTFNQEKKARMELKLAEMRLNQARHAAKNNNTEAMQKALEAHDKIIQRIQERVQKIESRDDEKSTKEKIGSLYALEKAVQVHEQRIAKLQTILENENLTEQEKRVIEMRLEKAQNNTAHLQEVQAEKEDKFKTKLMAVANLTEQQAQTVLETLKESENKKEFRENMKEVKNQIKEQRQEAKHKPSDSSTQQELEDQNESD